MSKSIHKLNRIYRSNLGEAVDCRVRSYCAARRGHHFLSWIWLKMSYLFDRLAAKTLATLKASRPSDDPDPADWWKRQEP